MKPNYFGDLLLSGRACVQRVVTRYVPKRKNHDKNKKNPDGTPTCESCVLAVTELVSAVRGYHEFDESQWKDGEPNPRWMKIQDRLLTANTRCYVDNEFADGGKRVVVSAFKKKHVVFPCQRDSAKAGQQCGIQVDRVTNASVAGEDLTPGEKQP